MTEFISRRNKTTDELHAATWNHTGDALHKNLKDAGKALRMVETFEQGVESTTPILGKLLDLQKDAYQLQARITELMSMLAHEGK